MDAEGDEAGRELPAGRDKRLVVEWEACSKDAAVGLPSRGRIRVGDGRCEWIEHGEGSRSTGDRPERPGVGPGACLEDPRGRIPADLWEGLLEECARELATGVFAPAVVHQHIEAVREDEWRQESLDIFRRTSVAISPCCDVTGPPRSPCC